MNTIEADPMNVPESINVRVEPMPEWLVRSNELRGNARSIREIASELDTQSRVLFDTARWMDEQASKIIKENT